jgi:hypothetical protein
VCVRFLLLQIERDVHCIEHQFGQPDAITGTEVCIGGKKIECGRRKSLTWRGARMSEIKESKFDELLEMYVIESGGDGAGCVVVRGVELREELHKEMCVCGHPWGFCTTESVRDFMDMLDDPNEWTNDGIWRQDFEDGYIQVRGVTRVAEYVPMASHTIADKLQRRSDYLRKCFQDNPASTACLADELQRQAKEIRAQYVPLSPTPPLGDFLTLEKLAAEMRPFHNDVGVVGDGDLARLLGVHEGADDFYYIVVHLHGRVVRHTCVGAFESLRGKLDRYDRLDKVFSLNGAGANSEFICTNSKTEAELALSKTPKLPHQKWKTIRHKSEIVERASPSPKK